MLSKYLVAQNCFICERNGRHCTDCVILSLSKSQLHQKRSRRFDCESIAVDVIYIGYGDMHAAWVGLINTHSKLTINKIKTYQVAKKDMTRARLSGRPGVPAFEEQELLEWPAASVSASCSFVSMPLKRDLEYLYTSKLAKKQNCWNGSGRRRDMRWAKDAAAIAHPPLSCYWCCY